MLSSPSYLLVALDGGVSVARASLGTVASFLVTRLEGCCKKCPIGSSSLPIGGPGRRGVRHSVLRLGEGRGAGPAPRTIARSHYISSQ